MALDSNNSIYGFTVVGLEPMPTAQRQQADDTAQPLCSREMLQHVGN